MIRASALEPTSESTGPGPTGSPVRVFVSYDRANDEDLLDRLADEAAEPGSGFEIVATSVERPAMEPWDLRLRLAIRSADQVIVLCGEHSNCSGLMGAELCIAREEKRPCLLLWGRREPMCTRPATAAPGDRMYSWTREIVRNQIVDPCRIADADGDGEDRRAPEAQEARKERGAREKGSRT